MSLGVIIKNLNYRQIFSLAGWFFRHPLFMIATLRATLKTYRISQQKFPNIHGQLNKANAFRHALWCSLIAKKSSRYSKNQKKVVEWTKTITDWHEEFSPNETLAREMDLHNNLFGINFYSQNPELTEEEITEKLLERLKKALQVGDVNAVRNTNKLVYIQP